MIQNSKMRNVIYFILVFVSIDLSGQILSKEKGAGFLQLYNDSVITGKDIKYKVFLFKNNYFIIDSVKVKSNRVKFCQVDTNYYANTSLRKHPSGSHFEIRLITGKINYFAGDYLIDYGYYCKYRDRKYSDLKIINHKNVRSDFADNSVSMEYINKYIKSDIAARIVNNTGFLCCIGTLLTINKHKAIGYSLGTILIASYYINIGLRNNAIKNLIKGIKIYNAP